MATLNGGEGNDTITGTASSDTINGRGGNDTIVGRAGNDVVNAGEGDDTVSGDDGNDSITGGLGVDVLYGGNGNDTITDFGSSLIYGGEGDDSLGEGGELGWTSGLKLYGGSGNDYIFCLVIEVADGGDGNDTIALSAQQTSTPTKLDGGSGYDVLSIDWGGTSHPAGFNINWSVVHNFEEIRFKSVYGGVNAVLPNSLGKAGTTLKISNDQAGNSFNFSAETDAYLNITGHHNTDYFTGGQLKDVINALEGNDVVDGQNGNDTIYLGDGADSVTGGGGDDYIDGGDGVDTAVYSGNYADYTISELTYNTFSVQDNAGADGVDTIVDVNQLQFADQTINLVIQGMQIIGDDSDDEISGGNFSDNIDGAGGNDTLEGGLGNDLVEGGIGNDSLVGGGGEDFLESGTGNDRLNGGTGKDLLTGAAGNDTFVFRNVAESAETATTTDVITDFVKGKDKINLSAIDAFASSTANDTFVWKGTAAFSSTTKGEVRYQKFDNRGSTNDYTMVWIDNDRDKDVEMAIRLTGLHNLTESDFIL